LYKNGTASTMLDGINIENTEVLSFTKFLRKANYYWFCMMYKLSDPGVEAEYLESEKVNGVVYEKVKIAYDADQTSKAQNDTFILYFNPKSHLVDFFYFSLPLFGVNDPVLRMELHYEVIDGIHIATERIGVFPDEKGNYTEAGRYSTGNVTFGNNFSKEDLTL